MRSVLGEPVKIQQFEAEGLASTVFDLQEISCQYIVMFIYCIFLYMPTLENGYCFTTMLLVQHTGRGHGAYFPGDSARPQCL